MKAASLIHALRVALTGRSASPGLFEVAVLLGRPATRARIARAIEELLSTSLTARSAALTAVSSTSFDRCGGIVESLP